jgi:hypothetical protein
MAAHRPGFRRTRGVAQSLLFSARSGSECIGFLSIGSGCLGFCQELAAGTQGILCLKRRA